MTPLFKGILWVLIIVGLWGILAPQAKAEESPALERLIDSKVVIYVGECRVGEQGQLVFPPTEAKVMLKCIVGMEPSEPEKHYVLLYVNGQAAKLVLFNTADKSQTMLWVAGNTT